MPQIIPVASLERLEELSELCHGSREPLFLTKDGYGDLAVMSMEVYERMVPDADPAVPEPEKYAGAILLDAGEALAGLRRKYEE